MSNFFASYGTVLGSIIAAAFLFFGYKYINKANATKVLTEAAIGLVEPLNKKIGELEKLITKAQKAADDADTRAERAEQRAENANRRADHAVKEADRANARADRAESHLRQAVDILTQRQIPVPSEWTVAS